MTFEYQPPQDPLKVLHCDRDVLGVYKPNGLLSVPGRGLELQDSLYTRVLSEYPLAQSVHRLDMDTSGLMIFALRRKAERELKRQFRERLVGKVYEAMVWGTPKDSTGVIELPLAHDVENKPLSKVCERTGKRALTRFEQLESDGRVTRVRLFPETGRSHQLRVHLAAIGTPILGDRFYASGEALRAYPRLALQAVSLQFLHPYRQEPITLTCPVDF